MKTRKPPAQAFPLGHFLKAEMKARDWTALDVAERCSLSLKRINAILGGDRMSLREAEPLAYAFDVSATFLAGIQLIYEQWKDQQP